MNIQKLSPIAVAILLGACGGSSSDSPTAVPATASGKAVDGYLSGATVTCDANANGVADTGEVSTTTSATGAYSLACDHGLVLTGGTNIDTGLAFKGRLRAPSGSAVITPLTNLVALGLTPAKVAEVLGLAAGTDVTKLDPAQQTNGVYVNQALFQKTLALQQVIQQTADVIFAASVGGSASTAVAQAQYAEIAKSVAASLSSVTSATPLINSAGTVSSTVVTSLISASVSAIKASTDTNLAALKTAAASLDATRVADFAASSIVTQTTAVAAATGDALSAAAKVAQSDTVLTSVSNSLRTSNAFSSTSTVNLTAVATATNTAVVNGVIDTTTISLLSAAGVTTPPAATEVTNYFAIASDSIILGSATPHTYTLSQLKSENGITLTGPSSTMDDLFNLSFTLASTGTPITTQTAELGFELAGIGSDKRIFRFIIDKVNFTLASGQITASVPSNATITVYGRKADGVSEIEVTLTNLSANTLSSSVGAISFNGGNIITNALAKANSQTTNFFTKLIDSTGTFTLKGVLSNNIPIRTSEKHLLPVASVTIGGKSVGGPAVTGKVTIN